MSLPARGDGELDPALRALFAATAGGPKAVRQRAEFFVFFAETVYPQLVHYRPTLALLYHPNDGRPAREPVQLLAVLILQIVERLPDRQAAEAMQYDARWRLALHLSPDEVACDPSLLAVFRERLLAGRQQRLAFEAVLDLLVAEGWVPRRSKQRLDSTHVCGLLAHMSRLECARATIRLALEAIEKRGALPAEWTGLWERYVESKVDPRSTLATLQAKVREAGAAMQRILTWAHEQGAAWEQNEAVQLLRRVFTENYTVDAQGQPQQTRAQPPGAVHNPHEPEAQWSSKATTKDKEWVGYKTQIAETVQDQPRVRGEPTRDFITAIVTQAATASDKPGLKEVLSEQASLGLAAPDALYVDGAYVWGQSLKEAHDEGRDLRGPAPASPDRGKTFTAEAFAVEVAARSAVCPAGQRSTNCSRLEEAKTGNVSYRFEWNVALCGACPKRAQCVSATQAHRTLVVGEHHSFLQARRQEMQTAEFKQEMHRRNAIEGTQSELVRGYGLRDARYRGLVKVRLQNYLIGAACNLRRFPPEPPRRADSPGKVQIGFAKTCDQLTMKR
jgi:transposase